ncbi:hypothetical protein Lgra_0956 [Legionella gratiana]|uniref:Uncharacterized protein n=1 Tax=Legionella gratiana TaxID=45066 RepID=A0A378J3T5_9GAMM|nr:hypothetical protein [Legionella gratiana]KTD13092.1 hypothetical protein Lgra_0956 [Legionella gratiana]STX42056.1 Uncharacterised protein [Legionella gratiana]
MYVKRDSNNKICAIFNQDETGNLEKIDSDHPDVLEFISYGSLEKNYTFLASDLEFIRVLEDLITLLIKKKLISITDFPEAVVKKLVERNKIRNQFQNIFIIDEE